MAKFVIAAAAFILVVGTIEASPFSGLLGNGGVQNQPLGLLGGLANEVVGLTTQILDVARNAISRKTDEELVLGIPTAARVAASTVQQAKQNGATKAQAVEQAQIAVIQAIRPYVERVVSAGAIAAADQIYGPDVVPQGVRGYGHG